MDQTTIIIIAGAFLLLLCFLLTIASFSGDKFMTEYKKLFEKTTRSPFTVTTFLNVLNNKYFDNQVQVLPIDTPGGDFYNSKKRVAGLYIAGQTSLASFAVVAHELGHAYQDLVEHQLRKFHNLRKVGGFIGKLFLPIVIATIVALFFVENYVLLLMGSGIAIVIIIMLAIIIKAKTISIEKDASKRGLELLSEFLPDDEIKQCKKVLDSARLTYWGDLIKLLLGWSGLTNKTEMFK